MMAGLTNIVTVTVVLLAITYFVITRRSRFTVELETTVKTDPKTCFTYLIKEMDNFAMKFHPYMIKVETLESRETADYIYKEHDYYESVPLLPFWKKDVVLHSIEEIDLKNNVVKMRIDNKRPVTDFLGSRINITWAFNPHPDNPEWTLIKDTISNDFSYGMSLVATKKQMSAHEDLMAGIQESAPSLKMDLHGKENDLE